MNIINAILHFKTITTHKFYVFKYCMKAGLYWQGVVHDLSKYSLTEFRESVNFYTGSRSPIEKCKETFGYSNAWLHHKGRNKHHYEYWQDNFDQGGEALRMPFKYALEMVCDYLAAGKTYMKKDFSYDAEYMWWIKNKYRTAAMHPQTKIFLNLMFSELKYYGEDILKKRNAKKVYQDAARLYLNMEKKKEKVKE